MACGFALMLAARPRPGATAPFIAIFLATFACYGAASWRALARAPRADVAIVAFACAFRLIFLFASPALSDDLWRYRRDGRVLLSGGNPYAEPPAASAQPEGEGRINHPGIPTIYPPGAQMLFATGVALGGAAGIKGLVLLGDLAVMLLLRRLLRARGQPPARLILYAWNPLAVVEGAWSGHLEPVAMACALAGSAAIIQKRDLRGALLLAAGILVKLAPVVLLVAWARALRPRAFVLVALFVAAAFWPFRRAGDGLFAGLLAYGGHWLGNESLFDLVRGIVAWIDPTPALRAASGALQARLPGGGVIGHLDRFMDPIPLAKGICGALFAAWAFVVARRVDDPPRAAWLTTAAALLLAPTVHPWYLLWVLPWLCLFPSRPFLLLSGLAVLAYANLGSAGRAAEPYPWVRLVEYVPVYALLLAEGLAARRGAAARAAMAPPASG